MALDRKWLHPRLSTNVDSFDEIYESTLGKTCLIEK